MSIRINALARPSVGTAAMGQSACLAGNWWRRARFQEWRWRDAETSGYKGATYAIEALLLCCTALTKIHTKKNDKNDEGLEMVHFCASSERLAMHKLPVVTLCLVAALAVMTAFICLSGAFAPRDTEYGSGKAVFKHYIIPIVSQEVSQE
ncbi:hypothetical protein [Cupriavidus oxalaticus]|uniref:hypothetical protein n=1 Tax=Cupriavidus oxalaticus TaxID=96344 RepID=UPI00317405E5